MPTRPSTIAEAEAEAALQKRREAEIHARLPEELSDAELIDWVRKNDPDYRGLNDLEIYEKVFGDLENARTHFAEALRNGGQEPIVREFCIARVRRVVDEIVHETHPRSTE